MSFNQLQLHASTVINTFTTLYGKEKLTIVSESEDEWGLRGTVRSDGDLALTLNHDWLSHPIFGLDAITGSGNNVFTLNGIMHLHGDFSGRGNLTLNTPYIATNGNMLAVQNNLSINGVTLNNETNSYLYAGGNMDLNVSVLNNNENATIYAGGDMMIHKDNARNTLIYNQAGNIQSKGNMTLKTDDLTNTYVGDLVDRVWQNKTVHYTHFIDSNTKKYTDAYPTQKTESLWTETEGLYKKGLIVSGEEMHLNFSNLQNKHSDIRSGKDLVITGSGTLSNIKQYLNHQVWKTTWTQGTDKRKQIINNIICNVLCTLLNQTVTKSRQVSYEIPSKIVQPLASFGGKITAADSVTGNFSSYATGNIAGDSVASVSKGNYSAESVSIAASAKASGSINPLDIIAPSHSTGHYSFSDYRSINTANSVSNQPLQGAQSLQTISNQNKQNLDSQQTLASAPQTNAATDNAVNTATRPFG